MLEQPPAYVEVSPGAVGSLEHQPAPPGDVAGVMQEIMAAILEAILASPPISGNSPTPRSVVGLGV